MRKHGWQLPYHPLQVVAISVFLALSFAFYVFFVPFVGRSVFQYVVMGIYTPLGWSEAKKTMSFNVELDESTVNLLRINSLIRIMLIFLALVIKIP